MLVAGIALGGCKKKDLRELTAPVGEQAWEPRFGVAFGDAYTGTPLEMGGRAPNDVVDQRLFIARFGHADLVMEVSVDQVWGRGRYEGRPDQFLDVELGEVLLGALPPRTDPHQLLHMSDADALPAELEGQTLLLFLKWAPGQTPGYHHHLMPRDPELLALIAAMLEHADESGISVGAPQSKRERRKAKRAKKRAAKG